MGSKVVDLLLMDLGIGRGVGKGGFVTLPFFKVVMLPHWLITLTVARRYLCAPLWLIQDFITHFTTYEKIEVQKEPLWKTDQLA